ncbi:MAG TPA: serine hydrolase domain-containing protein [Ktedonobacterales bacterium]|nr:serine hydrolase domain-containing protein [Ktedonobacterales bacterium]
MASSVIDAIIQRRAPADGPGVAVTVIRDGETIYKSGYGFANLEWRQPIGPETVLGLGSVTKPFTAQAIMLLEQQGKLRLDDEITHYLPDAPTHGRQITIAHLLTHTSGIANFVTQPGFWPNAAREERTPEEVAALFADLPLNFEPGNDYSYSNSAYVLLGRLIETLSGMAYGDFIESAIFAPLGMTHSWYMDDQRIIPQRAARYLREEADWVRAPYFSASVTYAAGGLGSTLDDLILWDQALRDGSLISHEVDARMRAPVRLNDGREMGYGLGWGLSRYRERAVTHHAGGVPGYSSFVGRFLDDGMTIIVLSNIGLFDAGGLAKEIANSILSLPAPERVAVPVAASELDACAGVYDNFIGESLEVSRKGEALMVSGELTCDLISLGDAIYASADDPDITVRFEQPDDHGYARVMVVVPFYWYVVTRKSP